METNNLTKKINTEGTVQKHDNLKSLFYSLFREHSRMEMERSLFTFIGNLASNGTVTCEC